MLGSSARWKRSYSINVQLFHLHLLTELFHKDASLLIRKFWTYSFHFQIVIEGQRAEVGLSGMAIDDIMIRPCSDYGKLFSGNDR